jgi:hypothetical protein
VQRAALRPSAIATIAVIVFEEDLRPALAKK